MRLKWPLTGRAEEARIIEAAISAPDSSGIVVCGAAGVGKSRLAREALMSAAAKGCETRWVVGATSARALPLGALASWTGAGGSDSLQLVRGVIKSLTSGSEGTTVVVGVDDVHLLDDLSTFVLQQIVQYGAVKMLLTIRDGEPLPTATQEVWQGGHFDRLDLQPLSPHETTMLVSATLRGPLDPDAARRLWQLTRGNVLYLRNIVEQEVADGRIVRQHGFWRWIGDPIMPPGLVELIELRIGALPASVADVIDMLAVGEPIELAVLTGIADPGALEDAETRGLITLDHVQGGIGVRVAHPLYAEVRREHAPSMKLRRLRGLVADALAACDDRDDTRVVVRRAALSLDSDLKQDPDLLIRAAQGAVCLTDLPLANRLADAAIDAGGGAEAIFLRAFALSRLSRGEEADVLLAAIPTSRFTGADHARLAFLRAMIRLFTLADPTGAKRIIDGAAQAMSSGTARSCIDAFLAVYWATIGKPELARKSFQDVVQALLPDLVGAAADWAIALASGNAGRAAEAVAAAEHGYALAKRSPDASYMRFIIADGHVGALMLAGRIKEACDLVERMRQRSADLQGSAQMLTSGVAGRVAFGAGRLDTACSLLEPVVELLFTSGDANGWVYRYQLPRTIALAMRGLPDEARHALLELEKQRHPSYRCLDYEEQLARAWVDACHGALGEAIKTVLSAAATARRDGQFAAEVLCLQTATQFGDRSTATRLRELEAIVEGPRVGLTSRFGAALRAGDAAELASLSEEFDQMGDLVAAVDAAAHAAMAYRREGLRGSALGCSARAEALAEQCGGASTPALGQASERLRLTDREREIVMLLGEGLSTPAIAQRLSLSVRTVENHIYRAMAKTGAASRDELAALLPRHWPRSHD